MVRILKLLIVLAVVIITAAGRFLEVSFSHHPENKAVAVIIECDREHPFFAFNRADVEPQDSMAKVFRPIAPYGATCTVTAEVRRNASDDPQNEYVGESGTISIHED